MEFFRSLQTQDCSSMEISFLYAPQSAQEGGWSNDHYQQYLCLQYVEHVGIMPKALTPSLQGVSVCLQTLYGFGPCSCDIREMSFFQSRGYCTLTVLFLPVPHHKSYSFLCPVQNAAGSSGYQFGSHKVTIQFIQSFNRCLILEIFLLGLNWGYKLLPTCPRIDV